MARQRMSEKNTAKIREQTGLPVMAVLVRGGTAHRKDLCMEDGSVVCLYRDGRREVSPIRHGVQATLASKPHHKIL